MGEKYAKNARTLDMYERLREGKSIRKCEEAQRFGVDERSIQRDIDDIRAFLDERQMQGDGRQVIYDRAKKRICYGRNRKPVPCQIVKYWRLPKSFWKAGHFRAEK